MRAMLLAAGLGKRLLPLTLATPKPMIPVLGRPLAAQILRRLAAQGVDRAVVNLHHLPGDVRAVLGDGRELGLESLIYSHETEILGTAGGIGNVAADLLGGGEFVVHNADFLSDVDIAAVVEAHRTSGCLATLVLAPSRPGYTAVEIDDETRVVSVGGCPNATDGTRAPYLFTGLHVVSDELLDRIPGNRSGNIVTDVYIDMITDRSLGAYVHDGFWWEFGALETYLEGSLRMLDLPTDHLEAIAETDPVSDIDAARVAVGDGAVHDGVVLIGRVALGMASMVGEQSTIEDSVIMPGAWIPPGSHLRRAIIGPGTELPVGTELVDVLICADPYPEQEPPPGATREEGLLFAPLPPSDDHEPGPS